MFRSLPRAGAPCAFIAGLAACGGTDDPAPSPPAEAVSCTDDARLDSYAGELEKAGQLELLSFRFFDLQPSPPAKGSNTFHVQVMSADGSLMQGGLRVDLRMPDHGHGTSIEPVVSFEPPGTYTIEPLYLFMPGVWQLEFEALDGAGQDAPMLDSVDLHFCVEG